VNLELAGGDEADTRASATDVRGEAPAELTRAQLARVCGRQRLEDAPRDLADKSVVSELAKTRIARESVSRMSAALMTTLGPQRPAGQTVTSRPRMPLAATAWEGVEWHSAVIS
jgi:hypothetical protein